MNSTVQFFVTYINIILFEYVVKFWPKIQWRLINPDGGSMYLVNLLWGLP